MKIQLRQTGPTTTQAEIRNHHVLIDRPLEKGGADQGPMGGEFFLASVGGCFMSNLLAAINARSADVRNAGVEVAAEIADSPTRFAGLTVTVSAECADRDLLEKLVAIADRGCIMMNTLRDRLPVQVRIA
jgi:putative redox protein